MAGDSYYCIGIVNPGESYLYTSDDDKWTDFSIVKKELESGPGDAKYYTYDNFPIKAYGNTDIDAYKYAYFNTDVDTYKYTYINTDIDAYKYTYGNSCAIQG